MNEELQQLNAKVDALGERLARAEAQLQSLRTINIRTSDGLAGEGTYSQGNVEIQLRPE